jgi:membrane-associated protease RseP (regulator of RpoE activity)
MDIYVISFIAFFAIVGIIVYWDRKNWQFSLISIRKTKKGVKFFDRIAKLSPRAWKAVGIVAIAVCILLFFLGIFLFLSFAKLVIQGLVTEPGGGVLIPTPFPEFEVGYGYIRVPLLFFILLFPLVLIPHEFMHGILMRTEKVRIKSTGLLLLVLLPIGGFVEQAKKSFEKAKLLSKLRILSVGSFANFLMALLFLGLIFFSWPLLVNQKEVHLVNVTEDSPAYEAGLRPGMVITSVNNTEFKDDSQFISLLPEEPGTSVSIGVGNESYWVITGKNPENESLSYLGITIGPAYKFSWSSTYFRYLSWFLIAETVIAILNIMPIYPLDGGLILKSLVEKKLKKNWKLVVFPVTLFIVFLLFLIIFGPAINMFLR